MPISRVSEQYELKSRYPETEFIWVSFNDIEGALNISPAHVEDSLLRLKAMHCQSPFSGVLNRREKFVAAATHLSDALGLHRHTIDPLVVRDKLLMRRALHSINAYPRCWPVSQAHDFKTIPADAYPLIVKPRFGFNSRSVRLVKTSDEAEKIFGQLQHTYSRLKQQENRSCDFIAEEFADGTEHTVEALVRSGTIERVIFSDKEAITPPFFTEIGDLMPTILDEEHTRLLAQTVQKAITALGICNAWVHVEVKLSSRGPVVIEAAARMGGGYHEDLIEQVYGVDRLAWLMALYGERPIPSLPPAQNYTMGCRVVTNGAVWQLRQPRTADLLNEQGVCMAWPENDQQRPRLVLGPPTGFKNTVYEFVLTGEKPDSMRLQRDRLFEKYRGLSLRLPGFMVEWWLNYRGYKELDA